MKLSLGYVAKCLAALLISTLAIAGKAPVQDRSLSNSKKPVAIVGSSLFHTVRKGDTVRSIAFFYGIDHRTIIRLNDLGKSGHIYLGQRLILRPKADGFVHDDSGILQKSLGHRSAARSPAVTYKAPKTSTRVVKKPKPVKKAKYAKAKAPSRSSRVSWRWPHGGKVIGTFKVKGNINSGIDIAGRNGAPVYAAAAGKVVYAGNSLVGYGNLLIIDHNDLFLSAYAHNSRLLVKEKDQVRAGQKIANMGRTGTDRVKLHFQIRRKGIPVNPVKYLPKR